MPTTSSFLPDGKSGSCIVHRAKSGALARKTRVSQSEYLREAVDNLLAKYESSELAAELLRLNLDVILTGGREAIRAAREVATTVPIVFATTSDPVAEGFLQGKAAPPEGAA